MPEPDDRRCWIEARDGAATLCIAGSWRLADLRVLHSRLGSLRSELQATPPGSVDGAALQGIDTAAALLLLQFLRDTGVKVDALLLRGFAPHHRRIVDLVGKRLADTQPTRQPKPLGLLAAFGRSSVQIGTLLGGHLEFFGRTLAELARLAARPRMLRVRELFAQFGQVGVGAVPVVTLVTFLIGVVMAYLLGLQAEKYGANIFVVDGVALGMTREFSPLIVATIMAGRSGAAFTAQLGTMKLTEEIDAIATLGLDVAQVLVMPRVLALVISLPLLVFVGDVAGILGAMVMANGTLDITPQTFIDRLHIALRPRHYVIGLAKAPVFALFIAVIGCRMGMAVSRDTRSIGINTTSTVVQGIVAVILLDAIFAVVFQNLGL